MKLLISPFFSMTCHLVDYCVPLSVDESTNKGHLGDMKLQRGLQDMRLQISHFDGRVYDFPSGGQALPCPPPFNPFQFPAHMLQHWRPEIKRFHRQANEVNLHYPNEKLYSLPVVVTEGSGVSELL